MYLDDSEELLEYTTTKEEYEDLHKDDDVLITRGLYLTNIGECNIIVNTRGGLIPHFEIHSLDEKFKTCIMIFEPKYYFNNNTEFSKLNNKQIDELIEFLSVTDYIITRYGWICQHWESLNSLKKYQYYDNWQIADYNLLKEV